MKIILYIALFSAIIPGCKGSDPNFDFKKLEDFKFRTADISEGTEIKILSFSGGPVCTPEATYYFQYIGVIKGTSDTIRVLSPCQTIRDGEQPEDGRFSPWEKTSKIINEVMDKNGEKNFESENKIVVFNKRNRDLENKDLKTAIGTLSF